MVVVAGLLAAVVPVQIVGLVALLVAVVAVPVAVVVKWASVVVVVTGASCALGRNS